jgi:copper chaperone CopZ
VLIKTYICPDIHCENCAEKVKRALADAPVQGVDVLVDQMAVRVGLLDEHDDEMIKECLADAGFPPQEVLLNDAHVETA